MESENILEAKQVSVAFRIDGVLQTAVHHINLEVRRNEVLAIVGNRVLVNQHSQLLSWGCIIPSKLKSLALFYWMGKK